MWHVDDGSLHAYLDGALDALPSSEAARIREHLASCETCARRLEEERALRAEAHAILAGADPGTGEVPLLEELRARASARVRPRAAMRLRNLTWAASIVLAVGAGWMLRGSRSWRFSEALEPVAAPAVPASVERAGGPEAKEERPAEPQRAEAQREDPQPVGAVATEAVPAESPAVRRSPAQADAAPERIAPPPAFVREAVSPQDTLRRTLEAGRSVVAAVLADSAVRAEVSPIAPAAAREAFDTVVVPAPFRTIPSPAKAAADVAAPAPSFFVTGAEPTLSFRPVPGVRVLAVTDAEAGFPDGSVRVLRLIDGDTLETVHLPEGAARPDLDDVLPDGRTQIVVDHAGHWIVGRARVGREALEVLLARIDPGQ